MIRKRILGIFEYTVKMGLTETYFGLYLMEFLTYIFQTLVLPSLGCSKIQIIFICISLLIIIIAVTHILFLFKCIFLHTSTLHEIWWFLLQAR